jgi:HEAT repeat protein
VRRLYYQLQLAIARVNEIAENSMPLGGKHSAPGNAGAGTTPQEPGFELVYDGKTFSQWERLARTEVALEALKRVIEAIAALGRRDADPQRAIDVLKWIAETAEVKVGQSGAAEFRTANEAVEALVGFGEPAAAALIELIKSDSPEARQSAASNVTRLGESAQEAIPALIEATRSDDGSTRNVALQSLGRIGLNRGDVIAALKASLDDDAPRVRSTAAVALAQIGTADEIAAAIPTLREHLAKVAALPPKSDWPPSVPFIGGFDPNDESDEWRRDATSAGYTLVALYILDEHGTTPEDREVLAKYVRSPDATSMVSQRSFFRVGPDSPEYETLTRLRREAGLPAPGVFPSIERQQPPKPDGAKTSSQTPTSQPELVYGGKTFSEWERLARTEVAPEALQSVITALAALGHRDEPDRAVAALTSIAEKARPSADSPSDDDVFNPVMIKLYEFGESGQAAYVRLLTPLLTDPNHMRRRQAVSALAQIDAAAALQSTIPELLHILNEDPEIRRDEVIRALVNVGGNRDEVLAAIRQRLDADDQATQVAAHFALATIGTDEDVRSILPFLRRQLDTVSQMNVGNVFARMESGHLPVVINGLWRMGSKDDRELLKQFANAEAGKYAGEFEPNVQTTHPDAAHQAVEIIKQLRGELTTGDADDSPPDIPALPDESGLLRDTSGRVVGIWGIGPVPVAATR